MQVCNDESGWQKSLSGYELVGSVEEEGAGYQGGAAVETAGAYFCGCLSEQG